MPIGVGPTMSDLYGGGGPSMQQTVSGGEDDTTTLPMKNLTGFGAGIGSAATHAPLLIWVGLFVLLGLIKVGLEGGFRFSGRGGIG